MSLSPEQDFKKKKKAAGRHQPTLTLNSFKNNCDGRHRTSVLKTQAKGGAIGEVWLSFISRAHINWS